MRRRLVLTTGLIFAVVPLVGSCAGGQDEAPRTSDPVFEYTRAANTVVILFDRVGDFPYEIPVMRIFGDGRVLVNRRTKGEYEMHLSEDEIHAWLRTLYDAGVFAFDTRRVKESAGKILTERNLLAAARGEPLQGLHGRWAGGNLTIIEVRLNGFKVEGPTAERVDNYSHRIVWDDLRHSAGRFPELPELAGFADAADVLAKLADHPNLTPVADK